MKLLIWMNIPSHHQSSFFAACFKQLGQDFKVMYYDKALLKEREEQGWASRHSLKEYEHYATSPQELLMYSDFIHILPGEGTPFAMELVSLCVKNNVKWCHWSESSGIRISEWLSFNSLLYRLVSPMFFKITKNKYARTVNNFALGALAQGKMAENNFTLWGMKKEKIRHLFYSVPALECHQRVRVIEEFSAGRKVFLCSAQLCKRKGIDLLIKAFARINNPNWCLILVGKDQTSGKYNKLIEKLSLAGDILFTGVTPIAQMASYMGSADVFILPTRFDGWGVVLNEAASLGKPLISTTQCGAAWHLIEDGENGYRVKTGSVNALVKAMQHYISSPSLIEKHGRFSKELFKEFTPEKNAERLINTLTKWLENEIDY